MYRSVSKFLSRPPAGRFWNEVVLLYTPREIGGAEVLIAAIAEHTSGRSPKARIEQFTDYEMAGLMVLLADQGLLAGPVPLAIAENLDARLEREGQDIHFSQTDRLAFDCMVATAAARWRKR